MANASHSQETINTTAIAIDRDKNSQYAVRWAVDNPQLNRNIILVHVKTQQGFSSLDIVPKGGRAPTKDELQLFFLPYRGFCARRGVRVKEMVIYDLDVASALSQYITENSISTIVLGASSRNAITRAFRNMDVPSNLAKLVPDFCTVHAISKMKAQTLKQATRIPSPRKRTDSRQTYQIGYSSDASHPEEIIQYQGSCSPTSSGSSCEGYNSNRRSNDKSLELIISRNRSPVRRTRSPSPHPSIALMNNINLQIRNHRSPTDSYSGSSDASGPRSFHSSDLSFEHLDNLYSMSDASITSQSTGEMEEEIRRLKLELKETMEMYSSACKETTTAHEKVREVNQWRCLEEKTPEESKHAQEATFALVMMEKHKCKVAFEAAQMAQRLAEFESQKRKVAEKRFQKETEEKKKATDALAWCDLNYRMYDIEEIEIATNYFSSSEKIGEGGYGPVYKACLGHTPVAVKVLRPDISQGQKQFQREVEVLCRMRHPNIVLLLGACPQYGCLVYEYMERGSLEDRLFCRNGSHPLPWRTRFQIAAEIATALLFLHQTKPNPIVHRDLKPANILLNRNYVSKIGDVGLSRLVPPTVADSITQYHMTAAAGTFCYIDPEYQQTGLLGTKSDIYSLGVLLLQIITAKAPMGLTHQVEEAIEVGKFAEILDPRVPDWPVEEALSFAKLALQCCELRRKDRPDLGTVIVSKLKSLGDPESESEYRNGIKDQISPTQRF